MKFSPSFFKLWVPVVLAILFFALPSWGQDQKVMAKEVVGKVEHRREKQKDWRAMRVGTSVAPQSLVRTEVESVVTLEFEDGTRVIVQENTEISLKQAQKTADGHNAQVHLEKGRLGFQVKKMVGGKSHYDFSTSTATAAVRGTTCRMGTAFGRSVFACTEGSIDLNRGSGATTGLCSPCIAVQDSQVGFQLRKFSNLEEYESVLATLFQIILAGPEGDLRGALGTEPAVADSLASLQWSWDLPGEEFRRFQGLPGDTVLVYAPMALERAGRYYAFQNWKTVSGNALILDAKSAETSVIMQSAASDVRALFLPQTYTLRIQPSTGGRVQGPPVREAPKGIPQYLEAVADSGYRFTQWTIADGEPRVASLSAANTEVVLALGAATLTPAFSNTARTVHILPPDGGGRVTQSLLSGEPGTHIQLEAAAQEGYYFVEWRVVRGRARIEDPSKPLTRVQLLDEDVELQPVFAAYDAVRIVHVLREVRIPVPSLLRGRPGQSMDLEAPRTLERDGKQWMFLRWVAGTGITIAAPNTARTTGVLSGGLVEVEAHYLPAALKAQWEFFDGNGRKKTLEFEYR